MKAAVFPKTIIRYRNDRAAAEVGLGGLSDEAWIAHFAQFDPLADNLSQPMAMAYHGHQFRAYNPDIGDGRGFLFAQLRDQRGRLMDLGTKGSGTTPFSRTGDGRLTLKGAVREALATEMLEALGVPTSRTLSIVETGEELMRNDEPSPTRSAVMVRLSHGHIRFGSFQRLAALGDNEGLARLLAYSSREFYPDLDEGDAGGFLGAVSERMAVQAARMMAAGFVHGVLNTDNMNISGEAFDYGPWCFAPTVDPGVIAAYFDHSGLYAFGNQPQAIYWNIAALADALRPLTENDELSEALKLYPDLYGAAFSDALFRRLGVEGSSGADDQKLAGDLFAWLNREQLPFEPAMRDLFGGAAGKAGREASIHAAAFAQSQEVARLDERTPVRPGRLDHPALAAPPPTLLRHEVEEVWDPIADDDDWGPFEAKIAAIRAYGEALELDAALPWPPGPGAA